MTSVFMLHEPLFDTGSEELPAFTVEGIFYGQFH